jgi:hypothetical protein
MNSSSTERFIPISIALSNNPRGTTELIVCIILMVIATAAVFLRLYARKYKGVEFAADDYLIVLALVRRLPDPCSN